MSAPPTEAWKQAHKQVCPICQAEFLPKGWTIAKHCSRACANKAQARTRRSFKGRLKTTKGYWSVLMPEHPNASREGYVMEHRLVMEEVLGRYLTRSEVVHHLNGIKTDNRLENLAVLPKKEHDGLPKNRKPPVCPNCGTVIPFRYARRAGSS